MAKTASKTSTKKRRPKGHQSLPWRIIKSCFFAGVCLAAFLTFYSITVIAHAPKIDTSNLYSYLSESTTLYDDKGKKIDSIYTSEGNRTNLEYEEIPEDLINAVVAIEDKTFWKHHGFNIIRIFGAIWESLTGGGDISGTSTITQQLARNVYLSDTKSVRSLNRKVTEAWYTVILEHDLTKEQIIEAYMNTIYLGYNCYGVEAAARNYFNKSAKKLDLTQCVALAAIPKSPTLYAPIKTYTPQEYASLPDTNPKYVLKKDSQYITVYNGKASKERRDLILYFMKEQGYIDEATYNKQIKASLLAEIDLPAEKKGTSYFTDFVIDQVCEDLVAEGYTEENALKLIYTGGLKIYTTLDSRCQKIVEQEFAKPGNFPAVLWRGEPQDSEGNLLGDDRKVTLYNRATYLSGGKFTFKRGEYIIHKDGSVTLKKGKRLNFYNVQSADGEDISVEFKEMYVTKEGVFYQISGTHVNIPKGYKSYDKNGNVVLSAQLFTDYPKLIIKGKSSLVIPKSSYTMGQMIRQPQAAMVIVDNKTGAVKAMVGGRNITGDKLYNRALSPQQPGSSIKPVAVYSTALQMGVDAMKAGKPCEYWQDESHTITKNYGRYWTAASQINDAPYVQNGRTWPHNAYNGYKGSISMRTAIEQSCNVPAVRVAQQVGMDNAAANLRKLGITTVVTDGDPNDLNPAALALGGMVKGITPLEMASAYSTFPAMGIHREYSCYTTIKNSKGETILRANPKETRVFDEGVAWIVCDILRTTVSHGISDGARTYSTITCGKTGTTNSRADAWFCGFTHRYTGAIWIGNDVNIEMNEGSRAAARLWATIMNQYETEYGSFFTKPADVIKYKGEWFVSGTQKGAIIKPVAGKGEVVVKVCTVSGYLATPWCTSTEEVALKKDEPKANYYCPQHNKDTDKYKTQESEKKKKEEAERKKREEEKKKKEQEQEQDKPKPPKPDPDPPDPEPEDPDDPGGEGGDDTGGGN